MTRNDIVDIFRNAEPDYRYDGSPFCRDSARVRAVKWVMEHRLTEAERRIIILYAEIASSRKMGGGLNVNRMTLQRQIGRIKKKIRHELDYYERAGRADADYRLHR